MYKEALFGLQTWQDKAENGAYTGFGAGTTLAALFSLLKGRKAPSFKMFLKKQFPGEFLKNGIPLSAAGLVSGSMFGSKLGQPKEFSDYLKS